MPAHAVTLHLPDSLYDHFRHQAKQARRTLEAELLRIVETAAPAEEVLPPELEEAMARLDSCSDEELWQSARSRLSEEESARLEALNFQQQSTGLSADEKAELAKLLEGYERAILMRARSVGLLQERGHDVSGLLTKP